MAEKDRRILAIGAHPDDIEFGCGAILLQAAAEGAEITLLVCSRGESGSCGSSDEREAEARAAASLLNASIEFLDFGGDANMELSKSKSLLLAKHIRLHRPHLVLAPTTVENQHPDHVVVGRAAKEAGRLARYGGVSSLKGQAPHAVGGLLHFAIAPSGEPRGALPLLIDVSAQEEAWMQLMGCHASQLQTRRYVDLQLARARSLGLQAGVAAAQALWCDESLLFNSLNSVPPSARSL